MRVVAPALLEPIPCPTAAIHELPCGSTSQKAGQAIGREGVFQGCWAAAPSQPCPGSQEDPVVFSCCFSLQLHGESGLHSSGCC